MNGSFIRSIDIHDSWEAIRCDQIISPEDGITVGISGRIFERRGFGAIGVTPMSEEAICALVRGVLRDGGDYLARNAWGAFVLAVHDTSHRRLLLFRDPSGMETVFWRRSPDRVAFSTQLATLAQDVTPAPERVVDFIVRGPAASSESLFDDISELPAGWFVEFSERGERVEPYWLSHKLGATPMSNDDDLRRLYADVITAFAGTSTRVLIDLSGGVDSSVLLGMAVRALGHDRVVAATVSYMSIGMELETKIARNVARHLNVPLIEIDGGDALPFSPTTAARRLWNRPAQQQLHVKLHLREAELALSSECGVTLNGLGGDQVFCAMPNVPWHALQKLLQGKICATTSDLRAFANRTGTPYWQIGKQTAKGLWAIYSDLGFTEPLETPVWLLRDFQPSAARVKADLPVSPLRRTQALEVVQATRQTDCGYRGVPLVHPYLTQPIQEFASTLAAADMVVNDLDRFALRRAMRSMVPSEAIDRRWKSEYSGIYQQGVRVNAARVRSLLLDGWLVSQKLVNRDALRSVVSRIAQGDRLDLVPFLNAVAFEMWIQQD